MSDYKYMKKSQLIAACENMEAEISKLKFEIESFPNHIAWLVKTAGTLLLAARMLTEARSEESQKTH